MNEWREKNSICEMLSNLMCNHGQKINDCKVNGETCLFGIHLKFAHKKTFVFFLCNSVCDMRIQTNGFNNGKKTTENNTQMNEFEQRGQT